MGKILTNVVALSLLGGALAGAGHASASVPSMVGMTYSKAAGLLTKWNYKFEVATTFGTELPRDNCVVASQVLRPASQFGAIRNPAKLLLSLNCNAAVASATEAGKSAGSPEGRAAKTEQVTEAWRRDTPEGQAWCVETLRSHPDWTTIDGCAASK